MRLHLHRPVSESAAQCIVELALAMPGLLMILLGTIDVGRVFLDYIEMATATSSSPHGPTSPRCSSQRSMPCPPDSRPAAG